MSFLKKIILLLIVVWSSFAFGQKITLREKIGQMLIIGFKGKEITEEAPVAQAIAEYNIGGVILFDYDCPTERFDRNIENPSQVTRLNHTLQTLAHKANAKYHRPNLPLFISVDYEGGNITRLSEEYGFPATYSGKAMGKMSLAQVRKLALMMGDTLKSSGFNLDFAPVADVDVNPENPIIGKEERSFSSDPEVVAQFDSVFTQAFKEKKIECAYKHFPGHGSSTSDSHLGFVDVTDTWSEKELIPFKMQFTQPNHCHFLMTAHVVNRNLDPSGIPSTLSHHILTNIVRKQLKFDGIIVSDDMEMKAIADNYGLEKALTMSINAGVDMLIFGNQSVDKPLNTKEIIDIIEKQVKNGQISEERINNAYMHILKVKETM